MENTGIVITNEWEAYPFRESMHLTHRLALVSWHDAQYIESYYQIAELTKTDEDGKRHYKVISGTIQIRKQPMICIFKYPIELL